MLENPTHDIKHQLIIFINCKRRQSNNEILLDSKKVLQEEWFPGHKLCWKIEITKNDGLERSYNRVKSNYLKIAF